MANRRRQGRLAMAVMALAVGSGCSLAPKSFQGVRNNAPLVRARAIPLGRGLPDSVVVPTLIGRLDDKDQVVRLAAFEELRHRTGQDFGFVPYAEPTERASAVSQWKTWWQGHQPALPRRRRAKGPATTAEIGSLAAREGAR